MKNNTLHFKRKYHQSIRSTKAISPSPPLLRSFYQSKGTLRTTACLSPPLDDHRRTFTSTKNQPYSPYENQPYKSSPWVLQNNRTTATSANNPRNSKTKFHQAETPISSDSSIVELAWKPAKGSSLVEEGPESFLKELKKNEIFYCCGCYQYVFEVEKKRHNPECRDRLLFANFEKDKILSTCWQRLERIVELSRYTATRQRQVQDLFEQVKRCEFSRMYMINYPSNCRFLKLDQIEQAFVYTYQQLLKGRIHCSNGPDWFVCF